MVEESILETARLQVRELRDDDLDALMRIFSDGVAMRYYPATKTREEGLAWIRENQERYRVDGCGLWACVEKETGEFVGQCGLVRQSGVDGQDELEVGYLFIREHWGRGLASEAARACVKYAKVSLGAERLISIIHPENERSIRVALAMDMASEKQITWHGNPVVIYALK